MSKKIEKRATPKFGKLASHRTETTRKYQCNAPLEWEALIKALQKSIGAEREADAIRHALAKGLGVKLAGGGGEKLAKPAAKSKPSKPAKSKVVKCEQTAIAEVK
jgi:hypothetical protein